MICRIYIHTILINYFTKKLTRNNNNLPFQVNLNNNKNYEFTSIQEKVKMFIKLTKGGALPWNVKYFIDMEKIEL